MTATYTWDIFTTLDGFGSYDAEGDWGGYWGKQGPEFLAHRAAQYAADMRLILGANTFRDFQHYLGDLTRADEAADPVNTRMKFAPTTVISSTLPDTVDWPDATVERGDGAEIVARLKQDSPVPLRSHGSPTLNRTLLAAGLVDLIQVTVFPVLSGQTGTVPVFAGVGDFDLDMISSSLFDGRIQELVYAPFHHGRN